MSRLGVTALALLTGAAVLVAGDLTTRVALSDLPPAVQKTVHAQLGKGKVGEIEKIEENGEVTYEVVLKRGRERTITVDSDGELVDKEMFLNEVPAAVRAAIEKRLAGGTLEGITKLLDVEPIAFEVEIASAGKPRTFTFDESGKLLHMQLALSETPGEVQASLRKEAAGAKLGEITQVFEDEITYEAEINPGASSRTVTIDPKGQVVSREIRIPLADAPAAVQKVVKELPTGSRVGTISKTTEEDEVSYAIEFKSHGKWETKTVGSDGKVID